MKLSLNLANTNLTFEVTDSISVKYTREGMEIIEDIKGTKVPAAVVQKAHDAEPNNAGIRPATVVTSRRCLDTVTRIIKQCSTNENTVNVRKLLEHQLSDKQFNDIIIALDIYVRSIDIGRSQITDWNQRIQSLMHALMFILAGYSHREVVELLNEHSMQNFVVGQQYSNLRSGSSTVGYRLLAELLWPDHIAGSSEKRWHRSQFDAEIREFQRRQKEAMKEECKLS